MSKTFYLKSFVKKVSASSLKEYLEKFHGIVINLDQSSDSDKKNQALILGKHSKFRS